MCGCEKLYSLTCRSFNILSPSFQMTLQGSKKIRLNSFKNTRIPNSSLCETNQKFYVSKKD